MDTQTSIPNYFLPMFADALTILDAFNTSAIIDLSDLKFQHTSYIITTAPTFPYIQLSPRTDLNGGAWKFHFSVAAENKNVMTAWSLIVDALMRDGEEHIAKVAMPDIWDALADPNFRQVGKIITLYDTGAYKPEDYIRLVTEVERSFIDNQVTPGFLPITNREIPGSRYSSYKRDCDEDGERRSMDRHVMHLPRRQRYNPDSRFDPYASFSL